MIRTLTCPDHDTDMILADEDSRQEWHEETYQCPQCDNKIVRRTEFDQNGLTGEMEFDEFNEVKK